MRRERDIGIQLGGGKRDGSAAEAGGAHDDHNTRHTYISYAISLGTKLATVCAQTGTSPAMIEKHYGRYMPQAGDFDLIEAALGGGRKSNLTSNLPTVPIPLSTKRWSIR